MRKVQILKPEVGDNQTRNYLHNLFLKTTLQFQERLLIHQCILPKKLRLKEKIGMTRTMH